MEKYSSCRFCRKAFVRINNHICSHFGKRFSKVTSTDITAPQENDIFYDAVEYQEANVVRLVSFQSESPGKYQGTGSTNIRLADVESSQPLVVAPPIEVEENIGRPETEGTTGAREQAPSRESKKFKVPRSRKDWENLDNQLGG